MARRALQTRQIIFELAVINLITCSSQNPISLRRSATSSVVQSCLIRTGIPARILLKGQVVGAEHRVSFQDTVFGSDAGRIFMSRQSLLAVFLTTPLLSKTRHLLACTFHLALSALNLKSGRHAICDL